MKITRPMHLQPWILFIALATPALAQRGPGGPGGQGGPGGPNAPDLELVEKYDVDKNGRLDPAERAEARKELQESTNSRGRRGRRGPQREPGKPGETIDPKDARSYVGKNLYDLTTLRTIFLEFDHKDWEAELAAFKPTDVLIPAQMSVDGKTYKDVGVSFRGASSFFQIPAGLKRSLNLSLDFVHKDQRVGGVKTLNLLNCNGDESMLSTVLYSQIARDHIPAPRANFAKVVINGESWGIYCNVEQFNKDFLKANFGTDEGARWKVSGSPRGDGGLRYLGEDTEPYRERFDLKSKESDEAWKALIHLCKVLDETPADELEAALTPLLNLDGVLRFLALDVVLLNSDGYWTRASDYSLYLDPDGRFHVIPHDMNEAFKESRGRSRGPGGPGERGERGGRGGFGGPPPELDPDDSPRIVQDEPGEFERPRRGQGRRRGGPGGGGMQASIELDPLIGSDDASKPLRSKLLANEKLRTRYLQHVRTIAQTGLDWKNLGPTIATARKLLAEEVKKDTRKLGTLEGFLAKTAPESSNATQDSEEEAPTTGANSLRAFAEKRSAFLLSHKAIVALPKEEVHLLSFVRTQKEETTHLPKVDSPLIINEVMADAARKTADNSEPSPDWIEIHNTGSEAIDLTGHFLSDNAEQPAKWPFPKGTTIEPGAYLLVLADGGPKKSKYDALHANFKLSKKGETVILSTETALLDQLTFPKQRAGHSYGRKGTTTADLTPTPMQPNRLFQDSH